MGGMAEIWSALDTQTDTVVALKVLLPELAVDQTIRTMFLDEVRLTMRLQHPNIVRVDGVFEIDQWLFQAMELLEGKDVRRLLSHSVQSGQRFPVEFAVMIAATSAQALSYAHALKSESGASLEIVHRDISPHNILVCADGSVKVLDFGIARAKERATKTAQGVIKGKLSYMAPEQAIAQPVDYHADIFSLGIVLWEMLAMRRLFSGNSDAETLALVCEAHVPSLCDIVSDVPEDLDRLVRKMLDVRPRNRVESMRAVESSLKKVLHQLENVDISEASIAAWIAPMLEERPRTQIRAKPKPPAAAIALKETRAEQGYEATQAYDASSKPNFDADPTTTLTAKPASTDSTTPSPVSDQKTEALDLDAMSQTLQEPDETDLVPMPSLDEMNAAVAQDLTFEAELAASPSADLSETIQGENSATPLDETSPSGLVVGKVGEFVSEMDAASPVDPLAATSLYSSEKREDLENPVPDTVNISVRGEREFTHSGPMIAQNGDESAKTAPVLDSLEPQNKNSSSGLMWAKLTLGVGILVLLTALFLRGG